MEAIYLLQYIEQFDIRRVKVSYLCMTNALKHHYRCSLYRKELVPKSHSSVDEELDTFDYDSEDEIVFESNDADEPGRFGQNEREEAEVMT